MENFDAKREDAIIKFNFPTGHFPERLDRYIGHNPKLKITRNRIQKLIENGLVTVDGKGALHNHILKGGEAIIVNLAPPLDVHILPEEIPLEIIFEDDYLLVVNKPAGMVTHPGAGNFKGTLVNALLHYSKRLSRVQGFDRPGLVHRLDKNTSGLIIVAKNDDIHLELQQQFQQKTIKKTYWALICGHMKQESGIIDLPIGRSPKDRKKMAVTHQKGRKAITGYKLLERFRLYDLLEINLLTGRTHQIRVHFAHLGHPILGDSEYGGRQKWHRGIFSQDRKLAIEALEIMSRQALHAKSLNFIHPVSHKIISLDSLLPQDFRNLLDLLKHE
ncbi:MAG: RluA family pseudouridine synthase [candidate division Zixibacteria bacterium]|nr:RluA family pseudouridine synthase [candidate division Zixibacteria bacterium]